MTTLEQTWAMPNGATVTVIVRTSRPVPARTWGSEVLALVSNAEALAATLGALPKASE